MIYNQPSFHNFPSKLVCKHWHRHVFFLLYFLHLSPPYFHHNLYRHNPLGNKIGNPIIIKLWQPSYYVQKDKKLPTASATVCFACSGIVSFLRPIKLLVFKIAHSIVFADSKWFTTTKGIKIVRAKFFANIVTATFFCYFISFIVHHRICTITCIATTPCETNLEISFMIYLVWSIQIMF